MLSDGGVVARIKDLRVGGPSITLRMGAEVKSIRIVCGDHEIDGKTDAGSFVLAACFRREA